MAGPDSQIWKVALSKRAPNATAASLLGLLHEEPMTGWDLARVAQRRIGNFWNITQSQVYRELAAMTKSGLIEPGSAGPRDRKPYSLTDAGREAFAAWIDVEPGSEQIRFPLLVTIMFAGHLSTERLAEMIAAHRARHAERLTDYEHQHAELTAAPDSDNDIPANEARFRLATLEFGLRYERATLDWLDQLPELLGHPKPLSA